MPKTSKKNKTQKGIGKMENLKNDFDKMWEAQPIEEQTKERVKTDTPYNVPMPTAEKAMKDKDIDYRLLSAVNVKAHFTEGEAHRYIMKKELDIETIAKDLGLAKGTVQKTFKRLTRAEAKVVEAIKTEKGIAYKINYSTDNKFYITVNHNILRILANGTNDKVIKAYLVLCYWLRDKNDRQISYEWIAEKIGYSTKGNNYSKAIKDIIFVLSSLNLISAELKPYYGIDSEGNETKTEIYEFHLNSYEEFKAHYERTMNKKLEN